MRYKPKPNERIAGITSTGREINPTMTVEELKIKKLKQSIPHTTKNKIITIN
jgi:hypothetical protein